VLYFWSCYSLYAQDDTRGTDFWLAFGSNCNSHYSEQNLQIRIVGSEQATTGDIYFTNLGISVPFSIAAGEVYTYNLSDREKEASYNITEEKSNLSIHITTSVSVTVYALNQHRRSTDATNVLPITALGIEYYHISYETTYSPAFYARDAYIVIATQDYTKIFHNGVNTGTLMAGETYYHTHWLDMTGDRITADKPIAFFAVNQGPQIPRGTPYIDVLFQQLAPVTTYGKNFFVPVSFRGRDCVRILASQNGTNITQIGGRIRGIGSLTNLNAGQWVELEVSLDSNGCYIQADKPVGVCAYLTSTGYNMPMDSVSDPAQAWLPSIEQKINKALIAPFIPYAITNLDQHYALIITPTATKNSTTVKIGTGAIRPLSDGKWYDNTAAGMSFYSLPLTNNTSAYLISNQESGLIIMGYGTGVAESYYYLASSAMRTLDISFYVNDIHYQNMYYEIVCMQPVVFRAKISGDISADTGHLKWYINDVEETAARDQITWSKPLTPGTYRIKIEVIMEDDIMSKTVEGTLTVVSVDITNTSGVSTVCVGNTIYLSGKPSKGRWESVNHQVATVDVRGTVTGLSTGVSEIRYIISEGTACTDTASILINVILTTIDAKTTPEICNRENGTIALTVNSDAPTTVKYLWNELMETTSTLANLKAGTYKVTVSDSFCVIDKTITVAHINAPVANFTFSDDVIRNNVFIITDLSHGTVQTWEWDMGDGTKQTGKKIDYIYTQSGDYTISLKVTDINGCMDSISKIIRIYDELEIWIPNTFTPNKDGLNDTWKPVISNYVKTGYQLFVYDRWGQVIFHTTDTEKEWDGIVNGKSAAPNAVYSYYIIVKDISKKDHKFTGKITLIR